MQTLYVIIIIKNTLEYSIHDYYILNLQKIFLHFHSIYVFYFISSFHFIIPVKIVLNSIQMKLIKVFIKNTENGEVFSRSKYYSSLLNDSCDKLKNLVSLLFFYEKYEYTKIAILQFANTYYEFASSFNNICTLNIFCHFFFIVFRQQFIFCRGATLHYKRS